MLSGVFKEETRKWWYTQDIDSNIKNSAINLPLASSSQIPSKQYPLQTVASD